MRKHFRTYCLLAVAVVAVALLSVSCIKDNDPAVGGKASVTMTFTTRVSDNVTAENLLDKEQMRTLRYGHQNELCKIGRRQKCCCGLFISELNENGLSCKHKTKCDIALQTLYV